MRFITALFLCFSASHSYATTSIYVKEGDFIKGELISPSLQAVGLSVKFTNHTTRRLLHNVVGSREFVFKAESDGEAQFIVTEVGSKQATHHYQLRISQHIPLTQQIALPERLQSPTMQALAERLRQARDIALKRQLSEDFWRQRQKEGTPLIERSENSEYNLVTFLWRGAKNNVILWGAPSFDHEPLQRLENSDIWFKTFELRKDTLISYGFAPDVPTLPLDKIQQRRALLATLQADPLNRRSYPLNIDGLDKFNYRSVLALENAPTQPYVNNYGAKQGQLTTHEFHSELLGNTRRIFIYSPPDFELQKTQPLLLFFFDGKEYTEKVPTPRILDNMIADNRIPSAVAIFIDNPTDDSRNTELPPNPLFARMLAEELYPWVTEKLNIRTDSAHTALIGSSYGGLAAAYTAAQYPNRFGNVLAMSGSFWWRQIDTPNSENNYIARLYAAMPTLPVRFFLSAGRYEAARNGEFDILNRSRHLKDVLIAKGYSVTYNEYATDHSYFTWQGILSDGLSALFGK